MRFRKGTAKQLATTGSSGGFSLGREKIVLQVPCVKLSPPVVLFILVPGDPTSSFVER
jgi:hypothetical protein